MAADIKRESTIRFERQLLKTWLPVRGGRASSTPLNWIIDHAETISPRNIGKKGALVPGQLADCAVLCADYFSIADDEIKGLEDRFIHGRLVDAQSAHY